MKVLHVIPSLSPARGGPGIVLRQLAAGLAARGTTVHIAATDDAGPDARLSVPHGVAQQEEAATVFYFPRQTRFYSFSWPLHRWLGRNVRNYDVVHIHALFSFPSMAAAWQARRQGVPYVIRPLGTLSRWGLESRRPLVKRISLALIERPALRAAAMVQATSEMERREILAACPECRVIVVPNPVEMPVGAVERPKTALPFTILFLSRIDPKKGLERLISAFGRCAATGADMQLVVAGGGGSAYVAVVRREARGRIRFVGAADAGEKRVLFSQAHLFVLPSYSENFGVAVVEAMAHGVPVVISPQVGIAEEVSAAHAGVVTACDEETLAGAILSLSSAPARLAEMSRNARELAARYAPEPVTAALLAAYEATMRGSGASA